jgi:hypothetical protein
VLAVINVVQLQFSHVLNDGVLTFKYVVAFVQFKGTWLSFEVTPYLLMAANPPYVYFGDLQSYFIVERIIDGFAQCMSSPVSTKTPGEFLSLLAGSSASRMALTGAATITYSARDILCTAHSVAAHRRTWYPRMEPND